MSQTRAAPLRLRLFLEGLEVPVISAQVNISPNQPSVAAIQVVPSAMALYLKPRTLVHLFYLSPTRIKTLDPEKKSSTSINTPTSLDEAVQVANIADVADEADTLRAVGVFSDEDSLPLTAYNILFTGEVIGLNFAKTPISRQIVLQCMDLSSYWDTCYQWFADYSVSGNALTDKRHQFVGAGSGLFDNIAGGHKWVIGRLLNTKPRSPEYRQASGLLGGMIHLLEAIGGIRYRKLAAEGVEAGFIGYRGTNDFFTIAEHRYNLLGQLGAVEKDNTSAKLYASKAFRSWLRNGMTSLGSLLSFRAIINHVCRYVFHSVYPNPVARYVPGGKKNLEYNKLSNLTRDFGGGQNGILFTKKAIANFNAAIVQYITAKGQADAAIAAPAGGFDAGTPFRAGTKLLRAGTRRLTKAEAYFKGVKSADDISAIRTNVKEAIASVDQALRIEERGVGGKGVSGNSNIRDNAEAISNLLTSAVDTLTNKVVGLKSKARQIVKRREVREGGHLYTQLLLPETFFVPPPRCNVIFPDEYTQLSYSRNFMREVSRLMLTSGVGVFAGNRRGAALLSRGYFAPKIKAVGDKVVYATAEYGGRILLPHETHTGIIPKFEWVTDGHRWGVKGDLETGKDGVKKYGKVNYLQRLANFQFFLHRWSSRTIALSMVFTPRLVLGFPAVVIDKAEPSSAVRQDIKDRTGWLYRPTQYIGKVSGLSHSVNQTSGGTSVQLIYCRTHMGLDDDLLGALYEEHTKDLETDHTIEPEELAKDPKFAGTERSLHLEILNLYANNKLKVGATTKGGEVMDFLDGAESVNIPLSLARKNLRLTGNEPNTGPPGTVSLPSAIHVFLNLKKGTTEFLKSLAQEDVMIPGWYADVWKKENIGEEVYMPLLGCRAITDNVMLDHQATKEVDLLFSDKTRVTRTIDVGANDEVPSGSIEEAINGIVTVYRQLKEENEDIHSFIDNFTYRPIASMFDIFGSADLTFDSSSGEVKSGLEGFHSRAFGDYNTEVSLPRKSGDGVMPGEGALYLLFEGASKDECLSTKLPSIVDRSEGAKIIRPELDPRGRARARVRAYLSELAVSRGLGSS